MAALNADGAEDHRPPVRRLRRAFRRRPRASRRARRAVPARAGPRPRARLLHPDRVRVLRHGSRGPAAGDRRRRTVRRARRAARRAADARHRVRHRARSADPGARRDRRRGRPPSRRRSRSSSGADPDDTAARLRVATDLRAAGIAARAELGRRKLGKQLEAAARDQAHFAVIVGDELATGEVGLRDLPAGTQKLVPLADLAPRDRARPSRPPPRGGAGLTWRPDRWGGRRRLRGLHRPLEPAGRRPVRRLAGDPAGARWVDVGCGTGALTEAILARAGPDSVTGIDPSAGFVEAVRERVSDARARFAVGDAASLPLEDRSTEVVVSGLVLNFIPDPAPALHEVLRIATSGATVAAYVWDYGGGMELLRGSGTRPSRSTQPPVRSMRAIRFPICAPEPLRLVFESAGLADVEVGAIEVPTVFRDFDDYLDAVPARDRPGAGLRGLTGRRGEGRSP